MMPLNPSDLEWWQWLLCAAAGFIVAMIAGTIAIGIFKDDNKKQGCGTIGCGCLLSILSAAVGIATLAAAVIGVVRLVKWIWNS